jgi:hypothetical protein
MGILRISLNYVLLAMGALLLVSCGAKVNSKTGAYVNLLVERQCSQTVIVKDAVVGDIENLYNELKKNYFNFFLVPPLKLYDYKNPLIVNLKNLKRDLEKLQSQMNDNSFVSANIGTLSNDVTLLYQKALRYEGQKCAFSQLSTKRYQDVRPYMEMRDFCQKKNQNEACSSESIQSLSAPEARFVEERSIKMCKAFDPYGVNCEAQMTVKKKLHQTQDLIINYQKRFKEEKFNRLFTLRDSHLRYSCQKNENDVTEMTLKVYSKDFDFQTLTTLMSYVRTVWSRNNFVLNLELADTNDGSDVIEILKLSNGISNVPDNNNRKLYLSGLLDFETMKKVMSHEFGHVLGFPDCYIEFYDNQRKDLIYYEMGADNTNIMCSLKPGVSVPDSYFTQLIQNSCVFN